MMPYQLDWPDSGTYCPDSGTGGGTVDYNYSYTATTAASNANNDCYIITKDQNLVITNISYSYNPLYVNLCGAEAAEQKAERERYEQEYERECKRCKIEQEEQRKREEEAEGTARVLMAALFGEEITQKYLKDKLLSVDSPGKQGRRYLIDSRDRIKVFEGDKLVDELCVNLVDGESVAIGTLERVDCHWLPETDVVLAKAFLVLNDEERLLSVANHNLRHNG